eukprot:TRINITY_DN123_c0_g1_i8.p1 TRINITY_DN123_c0_g1~~TRINITY_DN123_c0_g1_i8.p1  ORF type:complete len:1797 (+),score=311.67 TRINITY_DN123_c0_g1_i8:24-5393(+)
MMRTSLTACAAVVVVLALCAGCAGAAGWKQYVVNPNPPLARDSFYALMHDRTMLNVAVAADPLNAADSVVVTTQANVQWAMCNPSNASRSLEGCNNTAWAATFMPTCSDFLTDDEPFLSSSVVKTDYGNLWAVSKNAYFGGARYAVGLLYNETSHNCTRYPPFASAFIFFASVVTATKTPSGAVFVCAASLLFFDGDIYTTWHVNRYPVTEDTFDYYGTAEMPLAVAVHPVTFTAVFAFEYFFVVIPDITKDDPFAGQTLLTWTTNTNPTSMTLKFISNTSVVVCYTSTITNTTGVFLLNVFARTMTWIQSRSSPTHGNCNVAVATVNRHTGKIGEPADFIVRTDNHNLAWFTQIESGSWRSWGSGIEFSNILFATSFVSPVVEIVRVNATTLSLVIGQQYGMITYNIEERNCRLFDSDSNLCSDYRCNYCSGACVQDSCVECTDFNATTCPKNGYCSWCPETQQCTSECTTCNALPHLECTEALGCSWCANTTSCTSHEDYCNWCPDTQVGALGKEKCEAHGCLFCANVGRCSANASCLTCSSFSSEIQCYTNVSYCKWCPVYRSCVSSSSAIACGDCEATDTSNCYTYSPSCQVTREGCSPQCGVEAIDNSEFMSGFLNVSASEITAMDVDAAGNKYICSSSPPLVAKLSPTGETHCQNLFTSEAQVKAIAVDPKGDLFYVVGSGVLVPVQIDYAPSGVIVSFSPGSQDGFIAAFNTSNCNLFWSTRWGTSQEESFNDIKILKDRTIVIAATVNSDFPVVRTGQKAPCYSPVDDSLDFMYFGLVLFFQGDAWDVVGCSFSAQFTSYERIYAGDPTSSRVAIVGDYGKVVPFHVCGLGTCTLLSGEWNCLHWSFQGTKHDNTYCTDVVVTDSYDYLFSGYYCDAVGTALCTNNIFFFMQVRFDNDIPSEPNFHNITIPFMAESMVAHPYIRQCVVIAGYMWPVLAPRDIYPAAVIYDYVQHKMHTHQFASSRNGTFATLVSPAGSDYIQLAGWSFSPDFVSTNGVPFGYPLDHSKPVLVRVGIEGTEFCMPIYPSTPKNLAVTANYPSSAGGQSVRWPEFTFSWSACQFGVTCDVAETANCNNLQYYTIAGGRTGNTDFATKQAALKMVRGLPATPTTSGSVTQWWWQVTVVNKLRQTAIQSSYFAFAFVPEPWPTDVAESQSLVTTTAEYPATYVLRQKEMESDKYFHVDAGLSGQTSNTTYSVQLKFTPDHALLNTAFTWFSFEIRASTLYGVWRDAAVTVHMEDYSGNSQQWVVNATHALSADNKTWVQIWLRLKPVVNNSSSSSSSSSEIPTVHTTRDGTGATVLLDQITAVSLKISNVGPIKWIDLDNIAPTETAPPPESSSIVPPQSSSSSAAMPNSTSSLLISASSAAPVLLSSSADGGRNNAMLFYIIIPVAVAVLAVVFAALLFGGILFFFFVKRKRETPMEDPTDEGTITLGLLTTRHDVFEPGEAKFVPVDAFPIVPSTTVLYFGQEHQQANLDETFTENLTFSYPMEKSLAQGEDDNGTVSCRLFPPNLPQWSINFTPDQFTLSPNEAITVQAQLMMHCTAVVKKEIPLAICRGELWTEPESYTNLALKINSKISLKLDPEEIHLFNPAIGEGGFGTVFKGHWRGQEVAAKVIKNQDCMSKAMVRDFYHEVSVMERLRNPYIITFIGASHVPGRLVILTEFMPLGNVRACATHNKLSDAIKLRCMLDCARGMAFLHASCILHRDVKPDNLLMASLDEKSPVVCKLTDFGTVREFNNDDATQNYTKGVGTLVYQVAVMEIGVVVCFTCLARARHLSC